MNTLPAKASETSPASLLAILAGFVICDLWPFEWPRSHDKSCLYLLGLCTSYEQKYTCTDSN